MGIPTRGRYTQVNDGGSGPTSALLRGILSAQNEPRGWNAIVRPWVAEVALALGDTPRLLRRWLPGSLLAAA